MPDLIVIRDLEVHYRVGVPDTERAVPQRLLVTVTLELEVAAAAAADDLGQTVNYSEVERFVQTFGKGREWKLIEALAVQLAEGVRAVFGVERVGIELKKFILPRARYVSVWVERPPRPNASSPDPGGPPRSTECE